MSVPKPGNFNAIKSFSSPTSNTPRLAMTDMMATIKDTNFSINNTDPVLTNNAASTLQLNEGINVNESKDESTNNNDSRYNVMKLSPNTLNNNNNQENDKINDKQNSLSTSQRSPIPILPKPRSPSRSKSKSKSKTKYKSKKSTKTNTRDQLSKHINITQGFTSHSNEIMDSLHSEDLAEYGFPDTDNRLIKGDKMRSLIKEKKIFSSKKEKKEKKEKERISIKQKKRESRLQIYHSYYLEHENNPNMQYSYFHSRIKDKLVWYQDIEKLLPSTIPGQLIYALLNMIFSSDLYYSFHRYSFDDGFKTEHRMDDFFTSRRVLSIQHTIPGLFPSLLWYKILKYEPTPYKSMCYYQYVRQCDADQIYKLPVFFGYIEMILIIILSFIFCIDINVDDEFFNFNNIFLSFNIYKLLLFKPLSRVSIISCCLIFIALLHILSIFIVWRITWFLHIKIYDYKQRIFKYLARRRKKEIQFIESLYYGNKSKIEKEYKYRLYYKINPQSYLYYKRNGELFISLLKWLNVIEYEQDLDFLITSKKNWIVITFAIHKYIAIVIYSFILLFGLNILTIILLILFIISYWIHCIQLYTSDHHNLCCQSNGEYVANNKYSICQTLLEILKILLWPGILFYFVASYVIYITMFHPEYFIVIWIGISSIWLIIYSVLTRGYRRIYIFNGLALFMLHFVTINWYLFRNTNYYFFRYFTAIFLILFQFMFHCSLQFEIHRGMLFPQMSGEYKRDETAQQKFGLNVKGAKLYTFVQYASLYFKKHRTTQNKRNNNDNIHDNNKKEDINNNNNATNIITKWYKKWYIQRPLEALKIPKPKFPFVYK